MPSPYPAPMPFGDVPEVRGLLCYVIRHYGSTGLGVLISRKPGAGDIDVSVTYSDWAGDPIDIGGSTQAALSARYFQEHSLRTVLETMRLAGIPSACLYLAIGQDDLVLTDIKTGPGKLTGPGMVRDVFGRTMTTQEVVKIEHIDDDAAGAIERGFGSYAGDVIIKPSRFRTVERQHGTVPLYAEVRR